MRLPDRLLPPVDDEPPVSLEEAARGELVCLWADLRDARRTAINGVWSIQCGNLAGRIVDLSRLVGATPWGDVDVDVLEDGLYERLHQEAGIPYGAIDWQQVKHTRDMIEQGYSG